MEILSINWISIIRTINQILTAGVAITATSIFLYALAFNFRDRVARSFALILSCIVIIFAGEVIADVSVSVPIVEFWLRLKWFGIVLLPAAYLHFSDALLTLTGHPSRGRRRKAVWVAYIISFIFLTLIPAEILVGALSQSDAPTPYLERTNISFWFTLYYIFVMLFAAYNLVRAILRAKTKTSQRRLWYLFVGAALPALGSLPFLLHGTNFFNNNPLLFFSISILSSTIIGLSLILLAYSVAFFGVTWTDRVIKSRLFKWMMRGPFVAALVLGVTTIIRRIGEFYGDSYTAYVPISMVAFILLFEYGITLLAPLWEKWLFFGRDREDLPQLRNLEDHMLTRSDLDQFLEIILASICDRIQVPGAFIAIFDGNEVDYIIRVGDRKVLEAVTQPENLVDFSKNNTEQSKQDFIHSEKLLLKPLSYESDQNGQIILGICGFPWSEDQMIEGEANEAVLQLIHRAALALRDRRLQQQVLSSLVELQPHVDYIQKLRAVSGYNQSSILLEEDDLPLEDFTVIVKEALSHYWGGPKLAESPLMRLKIVKDLLNAHNGVSTNALRGVLRSAIERMKPEGEKKLNNEWILYNLLEMKFLEGKKVREIAAKLAMSEADLYRKQRVALEAVAKNILEMESSANNNEQELN